MHFVENEIATKDNHVTNVIENESPEIDKIRRWIVEKKITHDAADELCKILKDRLLPEIPKSCKTLLDTVKWKYTIVNIPDCKKGNGEFAYFGLRNSIVQSIDSSLFQSNDIQLILHVDGVKIFQSSSKSMWPISCKIFHDPDIFQPFTVAVYYGFSKPKHITEYLKDLITELNDLFDHGIDIEETHYNVIVKCFVADTPARAFLKCTRGHNAKIGACESCTVSGHKKEYTMV